MVELLVVIVIIAALAALSFTVLPRMLRKARATEAMSNLRQFGPLLTTYATEHSMTLPAIKGEVTLPDGTKDELQWTEVCLSVLSPDTAVTEFRSKQWWEKTKPFVRNPLYKQWTPMIPGFALNEMLAVNIESAKGNVVTETLSLPISYASITEPNRTPLIAPYNNFYYRFDSGVTLNGFKTTPLKDLLMEDKLSILFVDGHVESVTPNEYVSRELFLMPRVTEN